MIRVVSTAVRARSDVGTLSRLEEAAFGGRLRSRPGTFSRYILWAINDRY